MRRDESLENDECFIMFVMSHGKDNYVFGSDGQPVRINEIITPFTNVNCTFLKNKPKLVFIQACRGGTVCFLTCIDLMLLVGWQEGCIWPVKKLSDRVLAWLSV